MRSKATRSSWNASICRDWSTIGTVTYPAIDLQAVCWRVRQQRYLHRLSPFPNTPARTGDLRSTEDFLPPIAARFQRQHRNHTEAHARLSPPDNQSTRRASGRSNSRVTPEMLDHTDQDNPHVSTPSDDTEYASLTRRAATDN